MQCPLLSKSLLGLCALTVVAATACSDDFPTTNANSDYLVILDVTPENAGVNEEVTLSCTVSHEGEPVPELDLELRYTHLGADTGGGHDEKNVEADPCGAEPTDHEKNATGDHEPMGPDEECEPAIHVEMMHGEEPGTYLGTHKFEEAGNYAIEVEFEGHEGPEVHQLRLAIEGAEDAP